MSLVPWVTFRRWACVWWTVWSRHSIQGPASCFPLEVRLLSSLVGLEHSFRLRAQSLSGGFAAAVSLGQLGLELVLSYRPAILHLGVDPETCFLGYLWTKSHSSSVAPSGGWMVATLLCLAQPLSRSWLFATPWLLPKEGCHLEPLLETLRAHSQISCACSRAGWMTILELFMSWKKEGICISGKAFCHIL